MESLPPGEGRIYFEKNAILFPPGNSARVKRGTYK